MAVAGAVTSFFILVVVLMYSAMVWRSLDQYFKEEFKKHLEQDKDYQRLKRDKLDIMKEMNSMEKNVGQIKVDESIQAEKRRGCIKEEKPADKYKYQDENEDEYVDGGEVCPYVLPLSAKENNGG